MAEERATTLVVTLGPASLRPAVLRSLAAFGVDLLRLNLSHVALGDFEDMLRTARIHSHLPVCLDTEGAQVRVGLVSTGVALRVGQPVRLVRDKALGTERQLSLRPSALFNGLEPGTTLAADEAVLRVAVVEEEWATAIVVAGGRVRSNRPVVADPAPVLPALTDKDRTAVDIAAAAGVDHYALGYASSGAAVEELRALLPARARLLARIDSRLGAERRAEIIAAADTVVVGRRHLAAELPIEQVPFLQKAIARDGSTAGTPVWVATGRSGTTATPTATVAEASDVANLLLDGVSGLVVTNETAVGADPLGAVERVAGLLDGLNGYTSPGTGGSTDRPRLTSPEIVPSW
ncbi:MAG TPA: pyruvate kinase [Acidimicrobiia bacterium]|nr:pyruvate kinase [Acidimicrobiia bacterium]